MLSRRHRRRVLALVAFVLITGLAALPVAHWISSMGGSVPVTYPWHPNITATVFYCNQPASASNAGIANFNSAYDLQWGAHCGKENRYYVAVPYDDHGGIFPDCTPIDNSRVPWNNPALPIQQSELKNRWVEIQRIVGGHTITAYAQVEDVGPSPYKFAQQIDDPDYVFGPRGQNSQTITVKPKNPFGQKAGIDLSPDTAAYLGIHGVGKVAWRFWNSPDAATVPNGPWKKVVTTRPANAWDNCMGENGGGTATSAAS